MQASPVFIVAAAYGGEVISEVGQHFLASVAARCGATGFEVRREFFPEGDIPLEQLRAVMQEHNLIGVYSAPWPMWTNGGKLNRDALRQVWTEAEQAGAAYVKTPLGAYDPANSNLDELKRCIADTGLAGLPVRLTIENDASPEGGSIETVRRFFEGCAERGIPLRMTFDIGNWSWAGENVFTAMETLNDYVVYIHCKQVEDRHQCTGPLTKDTKELWRQVVSQFPKELPRGGEFPIVGDHLVQSTREYIQILSSV